jgi:GTP-binding protein EngB required for normal cell division
VRLNRPSQPLRLLLALALLVGVATLMLSLLAAADSALSVWQRLQDMPAWMRGGYLVVLALLSAGAGWAVWRLLTPAPARTPRASRLDRATVEARIERLDASLPAQAARRELEELDARRALDMVQVAMFGEISAGKSSLVRALAPEADVAVAVRGGTTTDVARYRGRLPDGSGIEISDVPGMFEAGGETHAALARAEAARSHAIVFVADGDLTRSQDAELRALAGFGRPLLLALNKIDRYRDEERAALLTRLRERYAALPARVFALTAGYSESVTREFPDGRRDTVERERAPDLGELPRALQRLAHAGAALLEPGREAALLAHLDAELAAGERALRIERGDAAVAKYTRRAVVGALAAVAPGTDLVIQGALATALLRELCAIHDLRVRDVDLDAFLARAGGLVRTTTSVTLAIAGNALKAFPGLGTLGGGLLHAVAYGLIFDSLGRAAAQTLAEANTLDRDATLDAFKRELERPAAARLEAIAALTLDAWRERGHAAPLEKEPTASPPVRAP